jgi:predicted nucleotidyltransferase
MAKLLSADLPADLDLVVLFGSRAQGTAPSNSDWDLGVRFSPGQGDPLRLYRLDVELATRLGCSSDAVDVVDLDQASYLLQRVVAEHGQPLFEPRQQLLVELADRVAI